MNVDTFLNKTLLIVWCAMALFATMSQVRAESASLADDPTFNAIMDSGKKFYRPWDKNRDPGTTDQVPDYVKEFNEKGFLTITEEDLEEARAKSQTQEYKDKWAMKKALAAPFAAMVDSGEMTKDEAWQKIEAIWTKNGLY